MKEPRHVVEKNGRYLVAIPAGVREHLGLVKGAQVWWHTTRKGDVAMTVNGRRARGRAQLDADCPSCARFREEATRLRTMLRTTTVVDYNTAFNQGVQQGVKLVPVWRAELDGLREEVRELTRLHAQLVVQLPARRVPRRRRRIGGVLLPPGVTAIDLDQADVPAPVSHAEAERDPPYADDFDGEGRLIPRAPTRDPSLDLPSSPVPLDGGDAASGAEPPGRPHDT